MRNSVLLFLFAVILALCLFPFQTDSREADWRAVFQQADSLELQRQFDKALPLWVEAEAAARHAPDSVREMLVFRLAYANALVYNYEKEGIPYFEKAYPYLAKSGLDTSRQATFLNTYYHFLGYNNRWKDALTIAMHCSRLRENTTEDPPLDYISVVHDLAFIHNKIGNYPQAIAYYKTSIDLYVQHKGPIDHDVALGYNNLAFNYGQAGMANKQYEAYSRAAAIWEKTELKDRSYLGTVYGNLIRWQMDYGDVEEVGSLLARIRELESAKDGSWGTENRLIQQKKDDANLRIRLNLWHKSIGLYARKQQFSQAFACLDSIKTLLSSTGANVSDKNLEYLESAYSDIGAEYGASGNHSAAIDYFEKALALKATHGYQYPMVHTKAKLAKSLMKTGDYARAREQIAEALALTRSKADIPLFNLMAAQIASKVDSEAVARQHIFSMLAGLTDSEQLAKAPLSIQLADFGGKVTRNYVASLSSAGHLYLGFYRSSTHPDDLAVARHLFNLASAMLGEYYLGGPYTETLADMLSAIDHGALQCQLLEPDQLAQARHLPGLIESLEARRSRHSWKKFLRNIPEGSLQVPDSLIASQEEHQKLIVHYKSQLLALEGDSAARDTERDPVLAAIHRHQTELSRVEQKLLAGQPVYGQFSTGEVNIAQLQKQLKGKSMLRYIMTDSTAYLVHIQSSKLQLVSLGASSALSQKVEDMVRKLRDRNDAYYPLAQSLYTLLLPDTVRSQLEKQLIIIPEGVLNYLPFEALSNTGKPDGFLVNHYFASYATSVPLWFAQEQRPARSGLRFAAFTPHYDGIGSHAGKRGPGLAALPGAAREASFLSTLFEGEVHQGDTIVESTFREFAPRYRLLHLAMHAALDEGNGERSHFLFPDSSRLHTYELYAMKLNADLAVLSACNTGQGPIVRGEGVQSLAKAFVSAGVPSIVMGLWQLPDFSTSRIISGFYTQLSKNDPKHVALTAAKRAYLKENQSDEALSHPYYWAGLVVSGNTAPLSAQAYGKTWLYLLAVVLAVAGYFVRKRRLSSRSVPTS